MRCLRCLGALENNALLLPMMNFFRETPVEVGAVLRHMLLLYRKSILYQLVFSVLYFSLLLSAFFFAMDHYGLTADLMRLQAEKNLSQAELYQKVQQVMLANPNAANVSWVLIGSLCALFPLQMGLFAIFRKIDSGANFGLADLFTGYRGVNFFIYVSYFLFWFLIFNLLMPTVVLSLIWVAVTLFVAPLMFFKNIRVMGGIVLTFQALKRHFVAILVVLGVAMAIKAMGLATFIGIPLVYGLTNVAVYALYQAIFVNEK